MKKYLFIVFIFFKLSILCFFLYSCDHISVDSLKEAHGLSNTRFPKGFTPARIQSESVAIGSTLAEVFEKIGRPMAASDPLTGERIEPKNYHHSKRLNLYYSEQIDPMQDYYHVMIYFEDGRLVKVESNYVWE